MKNKLLLFLFGFFSTIRVSLIGQIGISEIIALLYLPFSQFRKLVRCYPILTPITISYTFLLLCLVLSDIINESELDEYLRGWACIIFSFISFWFIINQLHREVRYFVYYLIGLIIVSIFWGGTEIDIEVLEENTNYFKQRIMVFSNPIVLLFSFFLCEKKYKQSALLVLFSYALLCIILDARSNSVAFFLSTLLLSLKLYKIKIHRQFLIFWLMLFISIGYLSYCYYVDQVLYHDFGGKNAQNQLHMTTNPYNPFELLYYGRMGTFIAVEAVKERPLWGYGSWAKDPDGKFAELAARWSDTDSSRTVGYISSHSIVVTAWLWAGIGGGLAILYLLILLLKMGIKIYQRSTDMALLVVVMPLFFGIIWDFLFSPFGHLRITVPFVLAILTKSYYTLPRKIKHLNKPATIQRLI